MTAHAQRTDAARPSRPSGEPGVPHLGGEHPPEALVALSTVLVVLAGPVVRALAPDVLWLNVVAVPVLLLGLVLAAVAAVGLVRELT